MTIQLKGGHTTEDMRLDRVPEFDEASRGFPVTALALPTGTRSMTWPDYFHGNQGNIGGCVGFGHSGCVAARPQSFMSIDNTFALGVYHDAQRVDEWPGENYEGTSVLAGAKVMQSRGFYDSYHWCFSADDIIEAFKVGPVVFGVPWKNSMFTPRPSGLLEVADDDAGGHCILGRGLLLKPRLKGESRKLGPVIRWRQSWSPWGNNDDCFIEVETLWDKLISNKRGEACVPVKKDRW